MLVTWNGADPISVPLDDGNVWVLHPTGTYNIPKSSYELLLATFPDDVKVAIKEEGIIDGITEGAYYVPATGEILPDIDALWNHLSENPDVPAVQMIGAIGWSPTIPQIGQLVYNTRKTTIDTEEELGDEVIECDPSSGSFAVNLLPAADGQRVLMVKLVNAKNANQVTIVADWSDLIDGRPEYILSTENDCVQLISSGISWNVVTSLQNSGQVKINTWEWIKPTLVYSGWTVGDFQQITYTSPLWLSGTPTTSWPKNVPLADRGESDLYDFVNDTFLENKVPWQQNTFRVIVNFSGKWSGQLTGIIIRLENTLSWFVLEDTRTLPNELTDWSMTFYLTTIADAASLPAPYGTGQWYEMSLYSDDPITLEIDSITRLSAQK